MPLFNAQKKHDLNYFALEMAAVIVARGGTAENREKGRRERIFPHVWIYFEYQKKTLFKHIVIQEIKDDLEPSTRSHAIPALLKPSFFGLRFFSTYCGFFISLFFISDYTNLRCAWYIDEMLRLCSLICAFPSHRRCFGIGTNLLCLVKMSLNLKQLGSVFCDTSYLSHAS